MLFAEVVATSEVVAATPSRSAKIAALAALLTGLGPDEVGPAVAMLGGEVRQGRVGVGWATLEAVGAAPAGTATLSVAEVDQAVERLARLEGKGSGGERRQLLRELGGRTTAAEAAFLHLVLRGELRQGAQAGVMTEAVARAAGVPADALRRAAMLIGDLPEVAGLALAGGAAALADVRVVPLRPVAPMLAVTAAGVADALAACGRSSVEWKLDGARVQVHRVGETVSIHTRNLNDVTDRLPQVVAAVRRLAVTSVVLDGEAIGLAEGERPQAFQDTMSRFGTQRGDVAGELVVRFFDCLHVDGRDLLDHPLEERRARLAAIVGPLLVPGEVTDDVPAATRVLDEALAAGHEGVMVKAASSPYEAGRRGATWRKVKPVHTVDLVVLAAEWGHGRRQGRLSNLHLGARASADELVMVGKTFKGMTDELLAWQTEALLEREVERDGIVVRVRPELVVEVALDGVQASRRYPGGVALRFARIRGYRSDKTAAEADTIATLRALLPTARPTAP